MNRIIALFIVLFVSSSAFGYCVMVGNTANDVEDLGGGFYRWTLTLDTDEIGDSFGLDLIFDGPIVNNQANVFGTLYHADTEAQAIQFDPAPDYDMDFDSWAGHPFVTPIAGNHAPSAGVTNAPGYMAVSMGTDPDSDVWGDGALAMQVVGTGEINVFGSIARNSANNPLAEGYVLEIPEPATMALMGLGGLAMLRRRRA